MLFDFTLITVQSLCTFNSQALAGEIKLVKEDIGLPMVERLLQTHKEWETEGSIPGVTNFHYSERGYGHSETAGL